MRLLQRATPLILLLAAGCGPALRPADGAVTKDEPSARVAMLQNLEDEVLRDLAAIDRRVAVRAKLRARDDDLRRVTMGALLAEDATLAAVDGAIDPFSFEARARGLAAVKTKLASAPSDLPSTSGGALPRPSFEKELLARLVEEESVRLDEERALPRSASALLRGVVETWLPPASPQQAAERDRWLARRLAEVRASISSAAPAGALDVVRARELDDALDSLERLAEGAGLVGATGELVALREILEGHAMRPATSAISDWPAVARGVQAHLGFKLAPEVIDARFATLEKALHTAAEAAIANAHLDGDALTTRAAALVFGAASCKANAVAGSRLRSIAPPPERAAACRLREAVTAATDDASRASVLVALHDHVVVAQWALDVARGTATMVETTARHRPLSRPPPDVVARWERVALARATVALGGGFAAGILYETSGIADIGRRAQEWTAFGDTPFDIAERELRLNGEAPPL